MFIVLNKFNTIVYYFHDPILKNFEHFLNCDLLIYFSSNTDNKYKYEYLIPITYIHICICSIEVVTQVNIILGTSIFLKLFIPKHQRVLYYSS
jgi:hypothetical protein